MSVQSWPRGRPTNGRSVGLSSRNRRYAIGAIMLIALFAFELFNFDTTQFALSSLLGGASFFKIGWATILAIAFCAIDFAGLARIFTPEKGWDEPKEVWYLTGAWLLGATMNAVMTWWAVSLTLLESNFGNEVLSRDQLLQWVPIFVAVLVWLTRILFIGSISLAGDQLVSDHRQARQTNAANALAQAAPATMRASTATRQTPKRDVKQTPKPRRSTSKPRSRPRPATVSRPQPAMMGMKAPAEKTAPVDFS